MKKFLKNKYLNAYLVCFFIFLGLFLSLFISGKSAYGKLKSGTASFTSKRVIIADGNTGNILYDKSGREKIYPASTTKVLTALVALENGNLNDEIYVSENALKGQEDNGSHIGLVAGEKIILKDALYAMMMESANDASIAIAEHISGSVEEFAKLMNEKAKSLGMNNSHFVNPHGLFDKEHYTTPMDMVNLTLAAENNELVLDMMSCEKYTIPPTNKRSAPLDIYPTHNMFPSKKHAYKGFLGGKTGYVEEAEYNLISIYKNNDMNLISYMATNPSKDDIYEDTKKSFDIIKYNYKVVNLKNDKYGNTFSNLMDDESYKLSGAANISDNIKVLLPNEYDKQKISFEIESLNKFPVKEKELLGYAIVKYEDEVVGKKDIVANKSISRFDYLIHIILVTFKYIAITLVTLFMLLLAIRQYFRRVNRKKRKPKSKSK